MGRFVLNKTLCVAGLQCEKRLFLQVHEPKLASPSTVLSETLKQEGREIGKLARTLYPSGILIEATNGADAVLETSRHLAQSPVLFEAAFAANDVLARVDILEKLPSGRWHVIEVKSAMSAKESAIDDVAIQCHILRETGLDIETVSILHLNSEAASREEWFKRTDVTDKVHERAEFITELLPRLLAVVRADTAPRIGIGRHCHAAGECPFLQHCWRHIPTPSIFDLPALRNEVWDWYKKGAIALDDKALSALSGQVAIQLASHRTQRRWEDGAAIAKAMENWRWPLYFLDFETISPAMPHFDGIAPRESAAFQFSCLKQESPLSPIIQAGAYLHSDVTDPRPELIAKLLSAIGSEGSIVAYYSQFEAGVLQALANFSPEHADSLLALSTRLTDPLPIFRAHVYDPAFGASFSLKSVAPALLGKDFDYSTKSISDGTSANRIYFEYLSEKDSSKRGVLEQSLIDYCEMDTRALAALVDWLVVAKS